MFPCASLAYYDYEGPALNEEQAATDARRQELHDPSQLWLAECDQGANLTCPGLLRKHDRIDFSFRD